MQIEELKFNLNGKNVKEEKHLQAKASMKANSCKIGIRTLIREPKSRISEH